MLWTGRLGAPGHCDTVGSLQGKRSLQGHVVSMHLTASRIQRASGSLSVVLGSHQGLAGASKHSTTEPRPQYSGQARCHGP